MTGLKALPGGDNPGEPRGTPPPSGTRVGGIVVFILSAAPAGDTSADSKRVTMDGRVEGEWAPAAFTSSILHGRHTHDR